MIVREQDGHPGRGELRRAALTATEPCPSARSVRRTSSSVEPATSSVRMRRANVPGSSSTSTIARVYVDSTRFSDRAATGRGGGLTSTDVAWIRGPFAPAYARRGCAARLWVVAGDRVAADRFATGALEPGDRVAADRFVTGALDLQTEWSRPGPGSAGPAPLRLRRPTLRYCLRSDRLPPGSGERHDTSTYPNEQVVRRSAGSTCPGANIIISQESRTKPRLESERPFTSRSLCRKSAQCCSNSGFAISARFTRSRS